MRVKKLIKQFDLEERFRDEITLGTSVRLNPQALYIQLEEDANDEYSTVADLYAKTWVANPKSVKQWAGFEAVVTNATDFSGDDLTSLGYRLGDGTNEYWWNGAAWEVNIADWNTEAVIAANIDTFAVTERKIQVIINLVTTDATVTPTISCIKILYLSDVEFLEDLIYRSLVPMLKSEIRPIADFPITKDVTSAKINLNLFLRDTPYAIIDIDSVFDDTNDANHFTDLHQSYDSSTKIITLSSSITADDVAFIRFTYQPLIAVNTSQEYDELDSVPAIALTDINETDSFQYSWAADSVANKALGTAVVVPAPNQFDIEFTMRILTDKAVDQVRLADEVKSFFANNLYLISSALDEKYDICLTSEYDAQTAPGQKGLHVGIFMFKIKKALSFQKQAIDAFVTQRLNVSGDVNVIID